MGYDIADYEDIDPSYGTLGDVSSISPLPLCLNSTTNLYVG